jgi:hypothetical protein
MTTALTSYNASCAALYKGSANSANYTAISITTMIGNAWFLGSDTCQETVEKFYDDLMTAVDDSATVTVNTAVFTLSTTDTYEKYSDYVSGWGLGCSIETELANLSVNSTTTYTLHCFSNGKTDELVATTATCFGNKCENGTDAALADHKCDRTSWNPLITSLVAAADPSTAEFTGKIVANAATTTLPAGILERWDWSNTSDTATAGGIEDDSDKGYYNPPKDAGNNPNIGYGLWEAWRFLPSGEDDRWVLEATWETEIAHKFYGIAD